MNGETDPYAEKRSAPRVPADVVVEIYQSDGKTLVGVAHLLNLSATGTCLDTVAVLTEKSSVVIRLLLKRRHLLTLPGDVVWVKTFPHGHEYGIQFGQVEETQLRTMKAFIDEYFGSDKQGGK
ncbi:MAG TPA: PilZ domain-containing protein [Elusimicrobiota bacterium]|nr:PilZ domain-containing protein [Elusimicrobiota bacterium]